MDKLRYVSFSLLLLALFISSNVAWGQSDIDATFSGAGARAVSMGRAFIAIADDATASDYNPAGMMILQRPELSLQFKYSIDRHEEPLIMAADRKEYTDRYFTPSFFSVVFPGDRFTLAFSQMTNVYFKNSTDESALVDPYNGVDNPDYVRRAEGKLHNWGITGAYLLHPRLYLGASFRYAVFDYYYRFDKRATISGFGKPYPFYSKTVSHTRDETFGGIVGLLWKAHRLFTLGLVYKTELPLHLTYTSDRMNSTPTSTTYNSQSTEFNLEIPSTVGIGLAFHPNQYWRIAMDIDHITWSEFDPKPKDDFRRNDVTNFHLGAEYYVDKFKWPVFIRGGYMYEESNDEYDYTRDNPRYPKPGEIDHFTFGLGAAFPKFQLDCAIDYSEIMTDFVFSTVYYF